MNRAAQALGRMAAGKSKRFSAAELALRTARIQKYNAERKKVAGGGGRNVTKRSGAGSQNVPVSDGADKKQPL